MCYRSRVSKTIVSSGMSTLFAKCNIQIVLMQILKSRIFYVDPSILILQLVHDYRSGNYSALSKADVEKLSALLILGEIGYDAHAPLRRGYNPGNQLLRDIETTYLSLKNLTEEDAKRKFIIILSELSYGKSIFYNVEKVDNPADLRDKYAYVNIVPAIPCITHNFFDLEPRRLLHSTHFKDIKLIGSSSTALILERQADILGFRYNFNLELVHFSLGILKSRIFYVDPSILILQLVHDYRSGNYSANNWRLIRDQSKPFYTHRGYNPGNQLLRDIETTYLSLKNLTEEDAKREFIRILSELSYGKSVHFFDLEPRRLLHSTHFKDIKRIGSSSTALILERRADILGFRTDPMVQLEETETLASSIGSVKCLSFCKKHNSALEVALQKHREELGILKKRYDLECSERRRLHNDLIELKGNIRLFCRCRRLNHDEMARGSPAVVGFDSCLENELKIIGAEQFKFDHIFRPEDNQEAVFEQTSPLVVSVLDGFNVCIFAYGQTGTGKTFTMEGTAENRGVNYRTFSLSEERSDTMRLKVMLSTEGTHEVPGLSEVRVHKTSDVWKLFESGSRARSVGSTNANEFSSRTKHVFLVLLIQKHKKKAVAVASSQPPTFFNKTRLKIRNWFHVVYVRNFLFGEERMDSNAAICTLCNTLPLVIVALLLALKSAYPTQMSTRKT
ncbi:kinesin-like protein KIN-14S [Tanacetum coccineum]|uniref:Kinesin-like protein KIN-14S n=1 Tax=Tanacetum coccineum TaxID=301880 RepID=A0ABQ5G127_9ASTR